MQPVYGNYKNDVSKDKICELCKEEEDTTEHLVQCKKMGTSINIIKAVELEEDCNVERWRLIIEIIEKNMNMRNTK